MKVLLKKGYIFSCLFVYMVDIQPFGEWILTVQLDNQINDGNNPHLSTKPNYPGGREQNKVAYPNWN